MMSFSKRAAIKSFYYLMTVDGEVSADEAECLSAVGAELDPEYFTEYRDDIILECEAQLSCGIDDEDRYELVLEGIDSELFYNADDAETDIRPRLLVWNMLVIALSNSEYSNTERKVIKHIVRVSGMDRSVFLEMEQIIKTNTDILKELAWLKDSDRPYSEIRPIADELERRQKVVLQCARELIEDELYIPVEKLALPKNRIYEEAKKIGNGIAAEAAGWGRKTAEHTKNAEKKLTAHAKKLWAAKKPIAGVIAEAKDDNGTEKEQEGN